MRICKVRCWGEYSSLQTREKALLSGFWATDAACLPACLSVTPTSNKPRMLLSSSLLGFTTSLRREQPQRAHLIERGPWRCSCLPPISWRYSARGDCSFFLRIFNVMAQPFSSVFAAYCNEWSMSSIILSFFTIQCASYFLFFINKHFKNLLD